MKSFSTSWVSSTKARKQRKYRTNAPLHLKANMTKSHLSKELRAKYKVRSLQPKTGDAVKIMRGSFKGRTGKIFDVNIKQYKVYVDGVDRTKRDGTKSYYAIDPSNLLITELNLEGKKRVKTEEKKK